MVEMDWDDAYANGAYIKEADDFPLLWAATAAAFRTKLHDKGRSETDISYGDHAREVFDLFLPDRSPKGLVIFVHGGYWKAFDKSSWSHLSAGPLAKGFAVAMPSYILAPEARISEITQQIARAIDNVAGRIAGPIHLAGHSAGGHLVTRMLCSDLAWNSCFAARVARVVSISGLHDLRPLLQTSMNDDFVMNSEEAAAESVILHKDALPVPVVAWVGAEERPAFIEQSKWLAQAWKNAEVVLDPTKHHFNVIDSLADPDSPLVKALLG